MSKPAFTFGSLFAGVGGFDLGFERAGGKCLWQVEWDKFAQGVLRRRFPGVPLFGDIRKVHADDLETPDVICYGFPCQDISQANNNRKGLDGDRSGLFYEATRLFREFARRGSGLCLTVAENVAGLLNVDDGKGLARVLRELAECGFVSGWATLDAQHFGVPQRRRRVFVVSSSGTERPERVLAFTDGLRRHFEKGETSRETGKTPANSTPGARGPKGFAEGSFGTFTDDKNAATLKRVGGCLGGGSENLAVDVVAFDFCGGKGKCDFSLDICPTQGTAGPNVVAWAGDETPKHSEDVSVTLRSQQGGEGVGVAFKASHFTRDKDGKPSEIAPPLTAEADKGDQDALIYAPQVADPICPRENRTTTNEGKKNFKTRNLIAQDFVVRKLTPVEACRLQGFPDDWNAEQELADGTIAPVSNTQRHKQMGNAVAVPVAEWLGRQIAQELNK